MVLQNRILDSNKKFVGLCIHPEYIKQTKKLPKGLPHAYLLLIPYIYQRSFGKVNAVFKPMRKVSIEEKLLFAFRTFPIGHHFYLVCQLAQNLGYSLEFPSINESDYLSKIEQKRIILGFVCVPYLSQSHVSNWITERKKSPFSSLDDFYKRNPVTRDMLKALVESGAFRYLHRSTTALEWMLDTYTSLITPTEKVRLNWSEKKLNYLNLHHENWLKPNLILPSHYQVASELPHLKKEEVALLGRLISMLSFELKEKRKVKWGIFIDEEKTVYLAQMDSSVGVMWKMGEGYFLSGTVKGFKSQTWIQIQSARYLS